MKNLYNHKTLNPMGNPKIEPKIVKLETVSKTLNGCMVTMGIILCIGCLAILLSILFSN